MLDQLLGSAYSAFDKNPNAQIALRITHPDGVAWSVAGRVLTLGTEAGAPLATITLRGRTMIDVAALIGNAGCHVVYLNPGMARRAADSLLPGGARQSESNGDALRAYDSLLWSVLDAFAVVLEDAEDDMLVALEQLYLGSASADLLEVWGDYFGLPRNAGELDAAYRLRIIAETLRPRGNKYAIENAIKATTGDDVEIYEPWRNLFVLGQSALDGADHMEDGEFWTRNVIQPVTAQQVQWADVLAVVEKSRAAGVIVAPPQFKPVLFADASIQPHVVTSKTDTRSMQAFANVNGRLDAFALSGDAGQSAVNWKVSQAELITVHNPVGLANPSSFDATRRNMRRANIVLSDSDPIGAINSILQRTYWIQPPDDMTLSGTALSDYDGAIVLGLIDEITDLFTGHVSFRDFGGALVIDGRTDTRAFGPVVANLDGTCRVGIESVHADLLEANKVMNPTPYLWGFSGAGTWSQDDTTVWQENTPWGDGIKPQS